jgi:hypothetical protein
MQREHDATMQRILGPGGSLPDPGPIPPPNPQKPSTCPCVHNYNYYSVRAYIESDYDWERGTIIVKMIGVSLAINYIEPLFGSELAKDLLKGVDVYKINEDFEDLVKTNIEAQKELERRLNCSD